MVTVTSTVPEPAGAGTVMDLAELTVNGVAATAPNFTPVTPVKLVPVMVTEVPPDTMPTLGETPLTIGGAGVLEAVMSTATPPETPGRALRGGGLHRARDAGVIGGDVTVGGGGVGEARGRPGRPRCWPRRRRRSTPRRCRCGVSLGKVTVVDEALEIPAPVSIAPRRCSSPRPRTPGRPAPCRSRSRWLEKATVTVEAPVVLTVPVQISRSCPPYPV